MPLGAQVRLPDFGDSAGTQISPADEQRIGDMIFRQIRATLPVIDDPEVDEYAASLGYSIVSQTHTGGSFKFFVIAEDQINAFATPGGYIGINSGLIIASESESEVASVVAHEVAHVTQRHLARSYELANRLSIPQIAGMIAAIIVGTQNADAGSAAMAGVAGATAQAQINFTRSNEKEADRVGMQYLAGAGYDPRAMPEFFEKLQTASRYYTQPPEFLSSHPVTTTRIADSRNRAEQYPAKQRADSVAYLLVKEKLRAMTSKDPKGLVVDYDEKLLSARSPNREAYLYGKAFALSESGKRPEAGQILRELVKAEPERMSFRAALAEHEMRYGDLSEALLIYDEAYAVFPDNKTIVRGYTEALVRAGQGEAALKIIDDYRHLYAMDSRLYRIAAEAHRQNGSEVDSHIALAEHFYLDGDIGLAIHQLRLADQQAHADYYLSSRITARLHELEREQREQMRR